MFSRCLGCASSRGRGSWYLRAGRNSSNGAFKECRRLEWWVNCAFFCFELLGDDSFLLILLLLINVSNFWKCYYRRALLYCLLSMFDSCAFANPGVTFLAKLDLVVIWLKFSMDTIAGCLSGTAGRFRSWCLLRCSGDSWFLLRLYLLVEGLNAQCIVFPNFDRLMCFSASEFFIFSHFLLSLLSIERVCRKFFVEYLVSLILPLFSRGL